MLLKIIFLFLSIQAWEVDNYNCRFQEISDSATPLNTEVNRRIQEVITTGVYADPRAVEQIRATNELRRRLRDGGMEAFTGKEPEMIRILIQGYARENNIQNFEEAKLRWMNDIQSEPEPRPLVGCNPEELIQAMRSRLASSWLGNLETWAIEQPFDKCKPDSTIYSGVSLLDAPILQTVGVNPVIRVGAHRIGVDKLSHFMTEGADYYEAQRRGTGLSGILQIGQDEENGSYGLRTTGIKSYGDLAANYSGYLFWSQLFEGQNPYLVCENNKWVQKRQFNWNDYVNPLFDESINCSQYVSEGMQNVVDRNTQALTTANDLGSRVCPLDSGVCRNVHQYYENPQVLRSIVGPRCLELSGIATEAASGEQNVGGDEDGAY